MYSGDELDSVDGSDKDGERDSFLVYRSSRAMDPYLELVMIFSNNAEFKEALQLVGVNIMKSLKITKNDKRIIYMWCAKEDCEWRINLLKRTGETSYQVREFYDVHTCTPEHKAKKCNSLWIFKKYEDSFRTDPNRNVHRKIKVNISKMQAYRA